MPLPIPHRHVAIQSCTVTLSPPAPREVPLKHDGLVNPGPSCGVPGPHLRTETNAKGKRKVSPAAATALSSTWNVFGCRTELSWHWAGKQTPAPGLTSLCCFLGWNKIASVPQLLPSGEQRSLSPQCLPSAEWYSLSSWLQSSGERQSREVTGGTPGYPSTFSLASMAAAGLPPPPLQTCLSHHAVPTHSHYFHLCPAQNPLKALVSSPAETAAFSSPEAHGSVCQGGGEVSRAWGCICTAGHSPTESAL